MFFFYDTLARWAHTIYPFDFPATMIDRWTFLLYFIWLGYRSMEQHRGVQEHHRPVVRISYRVISCDPIYDFEKY
jgi:hypothetical protein